MWRVGRFVFESQDLFLCFVERTPLARPRHLRKLGFATSLSSALYTCMHFSFRLALLLSCLDSLLYCGTNFKCSGLRNFMKELLQKAATEKNHLLVSLTFWIEKTL
jgi:hypothetical protein